MLLTCSPWKRNGDYKQLKGTRLSPTKALNLNKYLPKDYNWSVQLSNWVDHFRHIAYVSMCSHIHYSNSTPGTGFWLPCLFLFVSPEYTFLSLRACFHHTVDFNLCFAACYKVVNTLLACMWNLRLHRNPKVSNTSLRQVAFQSRLLPPWWFSMSLGNK